MGGGAGGGGPARCQDSCDGCCLPNDVCLSLPAQTANTCGQSGSSCSACNDGEQCLRGTCVPVIIDGGVPGDVGSTCTSDTGCGVSGWCLTEDMGFPGGYCTRECEFTMCPTGSTCVQAGDPNGTPFYLCLQECMTSSQCRTDYVCETSPGIGLCLPF